MYQPNSWGVRWFVIMTAATVAAWLGYARPALHAEARPRAHVQLTAIAR